MRGLRAAGLDRRRRARQPRRARDHGRRAADRVGAVDEYATPTREQHALDLAKLYRHWEHVGSPTRTTRLRANATRIGALTPGFDEVVQTGVMVLSPAHHPELLERVYHRYEERPVAQLRDAPLSWELLAAGAVHWIDPRFNYLWGSLQGAALPVPARPSRPPRRGRRGEARARRRLLPAFRRRRPRACAVGRRRPRGGPPAARDASRGIRCARRSRWRSSRAPTRRPGCSSGPRGAARAPARLRRRPAPETSGDEEELRGDASADRARRLGLRGRDRLRRRAPWVAAADRVRARLGVRARRGGDRPRGRLAARPVLLSLLR